MRSGKSTLYKVKTTKKKKTPKTKTHPQPQKALIHFCVHTLSPACFLSLSLPASCSFCVLVPTDQLSLQEAGLKPGGHASTVSHSCEEGTSGSPLQRSCRQPRGTCAPLRWPSGPALLLCAWQSVWGSGVGCRGVILPRGYSKESGSGSLFPPFQAGPLHYLRPFPALYQVRL